MKRLRLTSVVVFALLCIGVQCWAASQDFKGTVNGNTITAGTGTVTVGAGKTLNVPENIQTPAIAAGDMLYGSNTGILSSLAKGAANTKAFMNAAGTFPEWAAGSYIGSFTYDISTTGAASITGVGFKPSAIIFLVYIDNSRSMSIGFSVGTHGNCMYTNGIANFTGGTYAWGVDVTAAGTAYLSDLAMDADGFTYTKAKASSPVGTATVTYLAIR